MSCCVKHKVTIIEVRTSTCTRQEIIHLLLLKLRIPPYAINE